MTTEFETRLMCIICLNDFVEIEIEEFRFQSGAMYMCSLTTLYSAKVFDVCGIFGPQIDYDYEHRTTQFAPY